MGIEPTVVDDDDDEIDPPNFFASFDYIFQKLSLIKGMVQKVLRVYVDQCSGSLSHLIEIHALPPPHP